MSVDFDKIQQEFDALLNSSTENSHAQPASHAIHTTETDDIASIPTLDSPPAATNTIDDLTNTAPASTEHSESADVVGHNATLALNEWQLNDQKKSSDDNFTSDVQREVDQLNTIDELDHLNEHSEDGDLLGGLLDEINVSPPETHIPANAFTAEISAKHAEAATDPSLIHLNHEQKSRELMSILDEIDSPHNPADEIPDDDNDIPADPNDYTTTTATLEKERKKPYLLTGLGMAILTAGIGYYITNTDSTDHSSRQSDKVIVDTASTAIKPVPVPSPTPPAPASSANTVLPHSSDAIATVAKPIQTIPAPALAPLNKPLKPAGDMPATKSTSDFPPITIHLKIDPVSRKVISPTNAKNHAGWAVNLMSLSNEIDAKVAMNRLKAKGFHPEMVVIEIGNHVFYRVRIPNFSSKKAANQAQALFKSEPEYADAWVNHYRN